MGARKVAYYNKQPRKSRVRYQINSSHKGLLHLKILIGVINAMGQTGIWKHGSHKSIHSYKGLSHILLIASTISDTPWASRSSTELSCTGSKTPISEARTATCARTTVRDSFKIRDGSRAAGTAAAERRRVCMVTLCLTLTSSSSRTRAYTVLMGPLE